MSNMRLAGLGRGAGVHPPEGDPVDTRERARQPLQRARPLVGGRQLCGYTSRQRPQCL